MVVYCNMSRALVLSGGGFKGAVQVVPALELSWVNHYDSIYGISVGALNGVMLAMNKGLDLFKIWKNITDIKDMLVMNWSNIFHGLYSMRPLRSLIEQHVYLDDVIIDFYAGLVSLKTENYYNFGTPEMQEHKQLQRAIEASSCIVGFMVPPKVNLYGEEQLCVDGGFYNFIPDLPIERYDVIDIVISSPYEYSLKSLNNLKYLGARIPHLAGQQVNIYGPEKPVGPSFQVSQDLNLNRLMQGYQIIKNPIRLYRNDNGVLVS
jgi:predicted acylesterase/phospholipase RssA